MLKHFATTALLIGTMTGVPSSEAQAQTQAACAPRDKFVSELENTYGESRTGAGLKGATSMFEIWASAATGTWTILMTNPDGISCVMASGENWLDMPVIPAQQGDPA